MLTSRFVATDFEQGRDHLFYQESYSSAGMDVSRIQGLRWDGKLETIESSAGGDLAEDANFYYLARGGALLRIAR